MKGSAWMWSVFLPAALASTQAWSLDLSGSWVSKNGSASVNYGNQVSCEKFEVEFSQGPGTFRVLRGEMECGGMSAAWKPFDLELRGNDVFYQGKKVGMVTADSLSVVIEGESATGGRARYDLFQNGESTYMTYELGFGGKTYRFEGDLSRN